MTTPTTRLNVIAGIGLSIITIGAISALAWGLNHPGETTAKVGNSSTHTVLYEAEADAAHGSGRTAMYTEQTDTGGTKQGTAALPASQTLYGFHHGDFVYLSLQNQQPTGAVTCRITIDGTVVSEVTSDGGYTIATCQATVPR